MRKIILIVLAVCLVLPLCYAQQTSLGIFEQGECVNLIQLCADCSYNNISSIVYPNSTIKVLDFVMTKRGIEYNYTFCNTSQLGNYLVNGVGDLSGTNTVWAYDFEVTYTGKEKINTGEGLSLVISIIIMLAVGIFFIYLSGKFKGFTGKFIFIVLGSIIFLISILYSLVIVTQNFGGFSAFTESYSTFWFVMRIIIGIVLTFGILYTLLLAFKLYKIKRGLTDS